MILRGRIHAMLEKCFDWQLKGEGVLKAALK